jgi:hypothetical protein
MANKLKMLTELFRELGAPDPEGWARSQINEGIPQLARFLFLRQAWKCVIQERDAAWVENHIASSRAMPDAPGSGVGPALERMLAKGVTLDDLCMVARVAQWETLYGLCYLLDDPRLEEPEVEDVNWGLFLYDKHGRPNVLVQGLYESVLETDPTRREMRPPPPK